MPKAKIEKYKHLEAKLYAYHVNCAAIAQIQAEIDDLMSVGAQGYLPGYAPAEPADKVADRTHKILALEKKRDRIAVDVKCIELLREAVKAHWHMRDVMDNYLSNGRWRDFMRSRPCYRTTVFRWRVKLLKMAAYIWQEMQK